MWRVLFAGLYAWTALAGEADALAISARIQSVHLPFGTLLDPFYTSAASEQITGYTRCGDSAIWTGHYLAAEAFRYAVTGAQEAEANAARALEGIDGLLTVTGSGLLARCRVPVSSPYAAGIHSEERNNGVFLNTTAGMTWIGNTSRDQYLGVAFGLGAAYEHIPSIRPRIRDIATRMTTFLVDNNWNPPGGSTFALRPDQILGILQVARRIHPERFESVYAAQRTRLAGSVGTPVAFDSLSTSSYFKFNLIHITFYHLIRWEDSEAKGTYERAFAIARNYTAGHGNAFFDLIDHAIHGPDVRRDAGILEMLDLWLRRPRRDLFVDLSNSVRVCGDQACDPIPVDRRTPTDFLWQRNPFQLRGGGAGTIGNAGVDYLLPYWMARYHGVIPSLGVQSVVAPDSLVSLYGSGLGANVSIDGTPVQVTYASPTQVNVHVPPQIPPGPALIVVSGRGRHAARVTVANTAPQLFTLNASGLAAATAVDAGQRPIPVFNCNPACVPVPISSPSPVYLTLYGTGLRRASTVEVTVAGVWVPVLYSGPQPQFPGLDQMNVELPRNRTGRVEILLTADGRTANSVHVDLSN